MIIDAYGHAGHRDHLTWEARSTRAWRPMDVHIQVDPNLSVRRAHKIATQVEQAVSRSLDGLASVVVHVEPKGEEDEWDG